MARPIFLLTGGPFALYLGVNRIEWTAPALLMRASNSSSQFLAALRDA
jgi:hypothetical protein